MEKNRTAGLLKIQIIMLSISADVELRVTKTLIKVLITMHSKKKENIMFLIQSIGLTCI